MADEKTNETPTPNPENERPWEEHLCHRAFGPPAAPVPFVASWPQVDPAKRHEMIEALGKQHGSKVVALPTHAQGQEEIDALNEYRMPCAGPACTLWAPFEVLNPDKSTTTLWACADRITAMHIAGARKSLGQIAGVLLKLAPIIDAAVENTRVAGRTVEVPQGFADSIRAGAGR